MTVLIDQYGKPLRSRIRNSLENPSTSLSDPAEWLLDVFGGGPTDSGVHVNHQTAIGYPPLWRGINLLSGDVAKLPLLAYQRVGDTGKERAKNHAAYKLMRRRFNPSMTAFVGKRTLQYHALLLGNGYAAIFRSLNRPAELLILSPTDTHPIQRDGDLWYITKVGNEQRRLRAEDVLHIRGLSFDGLCGHSVIDVMREALGLGIAARSFGAKFFGSGSNQSGILMVPGRFKKEQITNALRDWDQMATGLNKAHKVALLQDGVKWQPTSTSPEQGQFNETRQFEIREVANILGIPPHKLGDTTRTSYNSLELENQSYLQDGLDHWLVTWEEECYDKLLTEKEKDADSHFFEFLREAYIQTDTKTKIESLVTQVNNGLLLPDEARSILNLQPNPDGLGQKFRMPSNVMVIDGAAEALSTQGEATTSEPAEGEPLESSDDAAAAGDIQATALNGAQVAAVIAIGDKVALGEWPGSAAKPAMTLSFPLASPDVVETFVDELEKFEPPEPEPQPSPFGGPPAPNGEPPAEEPDEEQQDTLAAAHRTIITNDMTRMVRRLNNDAKQLASRPDDLAAWLDTMEVKHGQIVASVVRDGINAHCVATHQPCEPLTTWAVGKLFDAYRQDITVAMSSGGNLPAHIEAMADTFERDLAVQIANRVVTGATS